MHLIGNVNFDWKSKKSQFPVFCSVECFICIWKLLMVISMVHLIFWLIIWLKFSDYQIFPLIHLFTICFFLLLTINCESMIGFSGALIWQTFEATLSIINNIFIFPDSSIFFLPSISIEQFSWKVIFTQLR